MAGELSTWLRALGPTALAEVLRHRPDACVSPTPSSLTELAGRLAAHASVELALHSLDAGTLELTEVLAGLDRPTRAELGRFVGEGAQVTTDELDAALERLRTRALAWTEPGEAGAQPRIRSVGALVTLWGRPLGLGARLRTLLGRLQPDDLDTVLATLGLRAGSSRAATHGRVVSHLTPARIRELAAAAPTDVLDLLALLVRDGPVAGVPAPQTTGLWGLAAKPDRGIWWAIRRGLVLPVGWDVVEMPREVGLALRGNDWHQPVQLRRPAVRTQRCDAQVVAREGGARSHAMADLVAAVTESVAAAPLAQLRSGGVGVRELRRLAKTLRQAEPDVVLALELAAASGLVRVEGETVLATDRYDQWRVAAPVDRLLPLLEGWWAYPGPITERTDDISGKERPPLSEAPAREDVRRLRHALVSLLAALPRGEALPDLAAVVTQVIWGGPMRFPTAVDRDHQAAAIWREAQALGAVANGAATPLGAALASGDPDALLAAGTDAMPTVTESAVFQADLTAVVTGTPEGALAELLDSAADRETRGSASTWRFSPESVRKFLDAGGSADNLLKQLEAVAAKGVPQPLAYLVRDVARRHGQLSVRPVACVVVSPDESLLAEVARTRSLETLRPVLLAPTVMASARPVAETLELLRAAGFAPTRLGADGEVSVERRPAHRAVHDRSARRPSRVAPGVRTGPWVEPPVDPAALAATLLRAPAARESAEPLSPTAALVRQHGPQLQQHEVSVLAHAIDHDGAVRISYVDVNGRHTDRVISEVTLLPPFVEAWCHLRNGERVFSISGIGAVSPA